MSWKDDVWKVKGNKKGKEFVLYELEYVKSYDAVIMDNKYGSYDTLQEAKNDLKGLVKDGDDGIIFEIDWQNKRHRQVCSHWGSWDNKKQDWESGTFVNL